MSFFSRLFKKSSTKAIEATADELAEAGLHDEEAPTGDDVGGDLGGPSVSGFRWDDGIPTAGRDTAPSADVPPSAQDALTPAGEIPDGELAGAVTSEPIVASWESGISEIPQGRIDARLARRRIRPLPLPSLMEQALLYRMAAEEQPAPEAAAPLWAAYLELCPQDGEGWLRYGCTLGALIEAPDALDQAVTALHAASDCLPGDPRPWVELAHLAEAIGCPDEALQHYEQAAELTPARADILEALAQAQDHQGMAFEAAETRRRIGALHRTSS